MSSTIQVRVDDELKAKSDSLFKDLGTDTTTAIRIFLTQAVAYNGFPFEIRRNSTVNSPYTPMSEESMLKKLLGLRLTRKRQPNWSNSSLAKLLKSTGKLSSKRLELPHVPHRLPYWVLWQLR